MTRTPTYTFRVCLDLHAGEKRPNPLRVARALEAAICATLDTDIAETGVLDGRWGQVTVTPLTEATS